jgi:hypothetical protein
VALFIQNSGNFVNNFYLKTFKISQQGLNLKTKLILLLKKKKKNVIEMEMLD